MSWILLVSGLLLGLAGSVHCLGMCGPLSWALPVRQEKKSKQIRWLLLYQAGRILSYSLLGILAGMLGKALTFTGYQQSFSIVMGATILLFGTAIISPRRAGHFPLLKRSQQRLQQAIQDLLNKPMQAGRMFLLGHLNGWLPCGMVYLGVFSTLTLETPWAGAAFMIAFGIGTVPAMMLTSLAGWWIGKEMRLEFRRVVPVMVGLVGLILIFRGLNLGIPLLSPEMPISGSAESIPCANSVHPAN